MLIAHSKKNPESVVQVFVLTLNVSSWVPGKTHFQMGVGGQFHIIPKIAFSENCQDLEDIFLESVSFSAGGWRPNAHNSVGPRHEIH